MNLWSHLWNDETGAVLSAEVVTVGTVTVLGLGVGLSSLSDAVNGELTDLACAIRSFDQSFSIAGRSNARAHTAGSNYTQPPVAASLAELRPDLPAEEPAVVPQPPSPAAHLVPATPETTATPHAVTPPALTPPTAAAAAVPVPTVPAPTVAAPTPAESIPFQPSAPLGSEVTPAEQKLQPVR